MYERMLCSSGTTSERTATKKAAIYWFGERLEAYVEGKSSIPVGEHYSFLGPTDFEELLNRPPTRDNLVTQKVEQSKR